MAQQDFNLYGKVVKAALHDENVRKGLASDPAGTLRKLGVNVTPDIERRISEAKAKAGTQQTEAAYSSAFVSSVVQVATAPAVSVVVSVATSSETEESKK
jgi:hypothetical protein